MNTGYFTIRSFNTELASRPSFTDSIRSVVVFRCHAISPSVVPPSTSAPYCSVIGSVGQLNKRAKSRSCGEARSVMLSERPRYCSIHFPLFTFIASGTIPVFSYPEFLLDPCVFVLFQTFMHRFTRPTYRAYYRVPFNQAGPLSVHPARIIKYCCGKATSKSPGPGKKYVLPPRSLIVLA